MVERVTIRRNPFARTELVRQVVPVSPGRTCDNCGQKRAGRLIRLFRYGVETDGGRQFWQSELFCSVGCMRQYHNLNEDMT